MSSSTSEPSFTHLTAATLSSSLHLTTQAVPALASPPVNPASRPGIQPVPHSPTSHPSSGASSRSNSDADTPPSGYLTNRYILRPKIGRRKSSGTMIVSSSSPSLEQMDEDYDSSDARTMSPRRTSEEIEALANQSRESMMLQARMLQESLLDIVDRVESIRSEHEKLEGGNRFLQSYIGELMQTSKITSSGAGKSGKGKGRGRAIK